MTETPQNPMKKVRLMTAPGAGQPSGLVVEGEVPPFITPPDVLVWGQRVFQDTHLCADDGARVYQECFAVHLHIITNPEAFATETVVNPGS